MPAGVERHALEARRPEVEADEDPATATAAGASRGAHPDLLEPEERQPARSSAGNRRREVRPEMKKANASAG